MLDIVQSFPLLSYCIVSPMSVYIYISPICNVEIRLIYFSVEIIKLGILYFSLFTIIIIIINILIIIILILNTISFLLRIQGVSLIDLWLFNTCLPF